MTGQLKHAKVATLGLRRKDRTAKTYVRRQPMQEVKDGHRKLITYKAQDLQDRYDRDRTVRHLAYVAAIRLVLSVLTVFKMTVNIVNTHTWLTARQQQFASGQYAITPCNVLFQPSRRGSSCPVMSHSIVVKPCFIGD